MRLTPFVLTQNLSLDNALSTIQVIHQLITQINKVIDELNDIDSEANSYTDTEITKVKSIISSLESELKSLTETNSTDIELLQGAINVIEHRLEELNSYVDSKNLEILNLVNTNYKTLCALYSAFKNEVIELLNANEPVVTNPTTGLKDKLSKCLLDIYTANRINTLDFSFENAKKVSDIVLKEHSLNTMQISVIKTLTNQTKMSGFSYPIGNITQYTQNTKGNIKNARIRPIDFFMNLFYWYLTKLNLTNQGTGGDIYTRYYTNIGTKLMFSTNTFNYNV